LREVFFERYTRECPKFSGLTYKTRTKWKMLRGIYSAIYSEVNISVSGGYVLQYAGGTRDNSCFICVTSEIGQTGNFWNLLRILHRKSYVIYEYHIIIIIIISVT